MIKWIFNVRRFRDLFWRILVVCLIAFIWLSYGTIVGPIIYKPIGRTVFVITFLSPVLFLSGYIYQMFLKVRSRFSK